MPTGKLGGEATALEDDLELVCGDVDATALINARIGRVQSVIKANDEARKKLRAAAGSPEALAADVAQVAALAQVDSYAAAYAAKVAAVKTAHAVTATAAEEHFDPSRGHLILKAQPTVATPGPGPAVIRKRVPMDDKSCDQFAAAYSAHCTAGDLAVNLQRQIDDYLAAHPPIDGEPGHSIPEPEALLALRDALDVQVEARAAAEAIMGAITSEVLKDERGKVWFSQFVDIATGEIVLGDRPAEMK